MSTHGRRRATTPALLLLVLAAGAGGWWFGRSAPAAPADISPVQRAQGELRARPEIAPLETRVDLVAAVPASTATPVAAATSAATPAAIQQPRRVLGDHPHDVPVLDLLELLGEDAMRGDATAACEIGRGLRECARRDEIRRMDIPPPGPYASPADVERHVEFEALRREWVARNERRCAGIGRDELERAMDYTARAARAGHIPSVIDLANAPAAAFVRDPQLIATYRSDVWSLLQRALATGNAQAAATAVAHIRNPRSTLWQVLPEEYRDPWAAEALFRMMTGIDPRGTPERRAPTADERAVARRWVDELLGGTLPKYPPPRLLVPTAEADAACVDDSQWLDGSTR